MQVYTDYNKVDFDSCVATIGIFDGVHLAHQMLLKKLRFEAGLKASKAVVVTFWPHPRSVLQPDVELKLLSVKAEKYALLEKSGCVDAIVEINFTKEFSELSAEAFCVDILQNKLHLSTLILGYDHHFGNRREGSIRYFDTHHFDFDVIEIEKQMLENVAVNSSNIRNELLSGNVKTANLLLGRNYGFCGIVVEGNKLGRTIGFATANISLFENHKLIPQNGVYAVKVKLKEYNHYFNGMLNIGFRPTVNGSNLTIEVHILDFDKDIYGQTIEIECLERIRDESKFDSIDMLKNQLEKDKIFVQKLLT